MRLMAESLGKRAILLPVPVAILRAGSSLARRSSDFDRLARIPAGRCVGTAATNRLGAGHIDRQPRCSPQPTGTGKDLRIDDHRADPLSRQRSSPASRLREWFSGTLVASDCSITRMRAAPHSIPTPRGGGLAIVLVMVAGMLVAAALGMVPWLIAGALIVPGAAVALIGWVDDHQGVPPLQRLAVHLVACASALALIAWSIDGREPQIRAGLFPSSC